MSRAMIGRPPGLDWPQTFVLKAAGDVAMERWERRLTLDQVAHRLAVTTRIARRQIEAALGPLGAGDYLYADDAPENPEIVLTLTSKGLEEYCYRFVQGYGRVSLEVLAFVCRDPAPDVAELARLAGRPSCWWSTSWRWPPIRACCA